jgi:hypothetical protein
VLPAPSVAGDFGDKTSSETLWRSAGIVADGGTLPPTVLADLRSGVDALGGTSSGDSAAAFFSSAFFSRFSFFLRRSLSALSVEVDAGLAMAPLALVGGGVGTTGGGAGVEPLVGGADAAGRPEVVDVGVVPTVLERRYA